MEDTQRQWLPSGWHWGSPHPLCCVSVMLPPEADCCEWWRRGSLDGATTTPVGWLLLVTLNQKHSMYICTSNCSISYFEPSRGVCVCTQHDILYVVLYMCIQRRLVCAYRHFGYIYAEKASRTSGVCKRSGMLAYTYLLGSFVGYENRKEFYC